MHTKQAIPHSIPLVCVSNLCRLGTDLECVGTLGRVLEETVVRVEEEPREFEEEFSLRTSIVQSGRREGGGKRVGGREGGRREGGKVGGREGGRREGKRVGGREEGRAKGWEGGEGGRREGKGWERGKGGREEGEPNGEACLAAS